MLRPVPKLSPPAPENPATSSPTAAELCITTPITTPVSAARSGFVVDITTRRNDDPKARSIPVLTIRTA